MKKYIIILLLILYNNVSFAQKTDTSFYLDFNINAKHLVEGGFDVKFKNLKKEFILYGKDTTRYLAEILNDTITVLSKFEKNDWHTIDTIEIFLFMADTNRIITPEFRIIDFNKDGNQDLLCWAYTNMNGNRYTLIYLNNPEIHKLVKLQNTTNDNYIWDNPEFNLHNKYIKCIEDASAYGVSNKSKYKLIGFKAIPLKKNEEDRTSRRIIHRKYVGYKGKWKLIKK